MKKLIQVVALLCLFLPVAAFGQNASPVPVPKIQFFDASGRPLAGGFVFTYSAGTTTPLATYTDSTGSTPNTNPVHLDSGGFANIWLLGAECYKLIVQKLGECSDFLDRQHLRPDQWRASLQMSRCPRTSRQLGMSFLIPWRGPYLARGKTTNTIINPTKYPGADIGAQINSVLISADCPSTGCDIVIPSNGSGYNDATNITNTKGGVTIECAEPGTVINWTPQGGTAFSTSGTDRVTFRGCLINTTTASSTATCTQVGGGATFTSNTLIEGWYCGVEDSNAHFAIGIHVTGTDTQPSGTTIIRSSHSRNFLTVGLQIDHAVDTYVNDVDNYAPASNAGHAWGTIVDTGASGFYPVNLTNGSSGMKIQNSMPTTNSFGKPPNYILGATNVINDTCYNSACLLFDASLSTLSGPGNAFVGNKYYFYGGWSSGCQLTNCSGIDVEGGVDIKFFSAMPRGLTLATAHC